MDLKLSIVQQPLSKKLSKKKDQDCALNKHR